MAEAEYEVVKSNVDGWDVRRVGEAQSLSNHATREQAEEAARQHGESGEEVDIRQDVFSEEPDDQDLAPKKTAFTFGMMVAAVTLLVIVLALIAALTDFGS